MWQINLLFMAIATPLSFMMLQSIDNLRGFIVSLNVYGLYLMTSDRHVP
jgi:hypothetical protein